MWELCRQCEEQGRGLQDLAIEEYRRYSRLFDEEVYRITAASSAAARNNPGGTAPSRVAEALEKAGKILEEAGYGV